MKIITLYALLCIFLVCINNTYTMEQQVPYQKLIDISQIRETTIEIISKHHTKNTPIHRISPQAIRYSRLLQRMQHAMQDVWDLSEREKTISLNFSDTQLTFIEQLLNAFASRTTHNLNKQKIIQIICEITENFTLLSPDTALHMITYFDIPLAIIACAQQ